MRAIIAWAMPHGSLGNYPYAQLRAFSVEEMSRSLAKVP